MNESLELRLLSHSIFIANHPRHIKPSHVQKSTTRNPGGGGRLDRVLEDHVGALITWGVVYVNFVDHCRPMFT